MAVETTATYAFSVGNGATLAFSLPFYFIDPAHIVITLDGVVQSGGYSVSGTRVPAGGTVTFVSPPAAGVIVGRRRVVPITQPIDTQNNQTIFEDVFDDGLDRRCMVEQQIGAVVARAVAAPEGEDLLDMTLPEAADRALHHLAFDTDGEPEASTYTAAQYDAAIAAFLAGTSVYTYADGYVNVVRIGATGGGSVDDRAALAAADISGTTAMYPKGTYRVASNLTLTGDMILAQGALLKPDSGVTITIKGRIDAGWYKIFDLSAGGTINLLGNAGECKVDWWGAVPDVVGTYTAGGFTVTSATDSTAAIQAAMDYGPYVIRYSQKGAYSVTSLLRDGSKPHRHVFPLDGYYGEIGLVGSGAVSPYLAAIAQASSIEKRTGVKYIIISGPRGDTGGFTDIWENPTIVSTDFDHVVCWGQLWSGNDAAPTCNFFHLKRPRFRGYIGMQIGICDWGVLEGPQFDGMDSAIAFEANDPDNLNVINKVQIFAPVFSQLVDTSGQIIWSKNFPGAAGYLKNVSIYGGTIEYGYYGVKNEIINLLLDNIWMERISDVSRQFLDNGRMILRGGNYSAGNIIGYLNDGSIYQDGTAIYTNDPAGGVNLVDGGKILANRSGWIQANAVPYDAHALRTPGNATEGDNIAFIDTQNLAGGVYVYATAQYGAGAGASAMKIGKNSVTDSSIKAGGTFDASGADCAEYRKLVERLQVQGSTTKGQILGMADGVLTDRWSEMTGRAFVKTTAPHVVGNSGWQTEEYICAAYDIAPIAEREHLTAAYLEAHYGAKAPEQEPLRAAFDSMDAYRAAMSVWTGVVIAYKEAQNKSRADMAERKAIFTAAYEVERAKWDRIAIAGIVPCNVTAGAADVGKYLVPVEGPNDTIGVVLKAKGDLTLAEYIDSLGVIEKIAEDGRPLINVKVT